MFSSVEKMKFVSRIRGARDVHELSADEFDAEVLAHGGKSYFTKQEYLTGSTMVTIPYDWDCKMDADGGVEVEKSELRNFVKMLRRLHPGEPFLLAKRHGRFIDPKTQASKWKVSYRGWMLKVKARLADIPVYVRGALNYGPNDTHPHLDLSVYKDREQLLGVIRGTKDIDTIKRYLGPIKLITPPCGLSGPSDDAAEDTGDYEEDTTTLPHEYLAQFSRDDAKLLIVPPAMCRSIASPGVAKKKKTTADKAVEDSTGITESSPSGNTETLSGNRYAMVLTASTRYFGEKYRMQEKLKLIQVNRDDKYLVFPTTEKWCFIKEERHVGNNPYITVTGQGSRWKCFDDECQKKGDVKLLPFAGLPKELRDLYNDIFFGEVDNDLMTEAKLECRKNITDNFPDENPEEVDQVQNTLMTLAKRRSCHKCSSGNTHFEHQHGGWCVKCLDCKSQWPNALVPFPDREYPKLVAALTQLNISIGNLTVNNVTASFFAYYAPKSLCWVVAGNGYYDVAIFNRIFQG